MCGSLCPYESVTPKPCSWGSLARGTGSDRDKWKQTQYWGHWNNIQDLSWFMGLLDYGWMAGIYPSCKQSDHNTHNMQNILLYTEYVKYEQICRICRICKPGRLWPLYSSSTETNAHACLFIPAWVLVSIVSSRSNLQNQILLILSWKAPSEIPGGRMNTQSWRLVCCNFFSVIGQQEMRIWPGYFTWPIRRVVYRLMCLQVLLDFCWQCVQQCPIL
jgi:hypothetical protein